MSTPEAAPQRYLLSFRWFVDHLDLRYKVGYNVHHISSSVAAMEVLTNRPSFTTNFHPIDKAAATPLTITFKTGPRLQNEG